MPLIYQKWITRADLQANPENLYVFGDNLQRIGMGGQAKEMRGEPNAFGIPTKVSPWEYAFDAYRMKFVRAWDVCFEELRAQLIEQRTIIWPTDGIGTGLANLKNRAPFCYGVLQLYEEELVQLARQLMKEAE